MKTGKTLVELATEIERRANAKRDFVANSRHIEMVPPALTGEPDFRLVVGQEGVRGINELAHDQIGGYCDIPAKYYDRCRTEAPELLTRNVNTWLQKHAEPRMIRTLDGKARAFLSDRYRPLENEELAEAILPILLNTGKLDIMSCEVTERRLYIKVVDKSVNRELAKTGNYLGDGKHKIVRVLAPAITISNSEVGCGALSIQAGAFDGFCSNLATFNERSMKKYHVGARHDLLGDEVIAMLSDETRRKTDAALWSQVQDVLRGAFDVVRFNELVDRIECTQEQKIGKEADVVQVVKLASRAIGVTESEEKGVLKALIEGGDLSRFGLYNAVTAFSQTVESYDRATELERIGAAVIELPQREWNQIALAS